MKYVLIVILPLAKIKLGTTNGKANVGRVLQILEAIENQTIITNKGRHIYINNSIKLGKTWSFRYTEAIFKEWEINIKYQILFFIYRIKVLYFVNYAQSLVQKFLKFWAFLVENVA